MLPPVSTPAITRPLLATSRLVLRPFRPADAAVVVHLAGDRDVAAGTLTIPHPYPQEHAARWISTHPRLAEEGLELVLAVTRGEDEALVGAVGLVLAPQHRRAELGYWIGRPYWGSGYATEAARALLLHGFDVLELNRIQACHFVRNPASGAVMRKIGMRYEGTLRQHVVKWDVPEDLAMYSVLREERGRIEANTR